MNKLLAAATIALLLVVSVAATSSEAEPKPKLPKITGGFSAQNFNSVSPFGTLMLLTKASLNARATAEGTTTTVPVTGWEVTVYPADGQVQARNTPFEGDRGNEGAVHGRVTCIANYGPAAAVDGDDPNDDVVADPAGDVWEIRFRITDVQGPDADDAFVGIHGSIYVQDGRRMDFEDENFRPDLLLNPDCGLNPFFGLEPVLSGNIKVHD